ncbi:MAG TPA: hypothetical protein VKX40_15170 [Aequorivita sp.]|nr:hypothetical protein [Aequorivita sp.]
MKKYVLLLCLITGIQGFSQDVYFQESNPDAKARAIKLTDQYNKELALDGDQYLLFQQKVEEFLIRRDKIETEFSGKARLYMLVKLQDEENAEMHNILTRPQLELYKKIHPLIQPIGSVNQEKKK